MWLNDIAEQLNTDAEALNLFDANVWLGRSPDFPLMVEGTPEIILRTHQKCRVKEALLSHWLTRHDASREGNMLLLQATESCPNWHAAVTLHPTVPGCDDTTSQLATLMSGKVKAVRVFPATFGYCLVDWCVGPLCETLIDRHLPLFVFHTETSFQELYELAGRYPELTIILDSQHRKILYYTPTVVQLMQARPNICLEISNYCAQGILDYTVNSLGPERLIFGTFTPANDPLVALGMLSQAKVSWEAKRAIGGDNMRRIISEVRH